MVEFVDSLMINVGAFFLIAGGLLLLAAIIALVGDLVGWIWIKASVRWRGILRAESLIYEYRCNRDAFRRWKEEQNV